MALTLRLENVDALDDGGPVSVTLGEQTIHVGRGAAMDWVLPDPSRHLSSHHFDVVYRDGNHWVEDVSTNGTYLQGQRYRLDGPHRLCVGDRLQVGSYIIAAEETGAMRDARSNAPGVATSFAPASDGASFDDDPWAVGGALSPIDPLPPARIGPRDDFAGEFLSTPDRADPPPFHGTSDASPQHGVLTPASRPAIAALPGHDVGANAASATPEPYHAYGPEPEPSEVIAAFCEGAGLDPAQYGDADALALVREAGAAIRGMTDNGMEHLRARAAFRQETRGQVQRTMAGLAGNPLKTAPHPERALEELFFRPRAGASTGAEAVTSAMRDLKLHHMAVVAALQPALGALLRDLAPEAVEASGNGGLLSGSRKGRAWDTFVERWDAKVAPHENGMLDEFFVHFSKAYAEALRSADD